MTLAVGKRAGVDPAKSAANQIFKSRAHAVELLNPSGKRERVLLMSKWLNAEIQDTMGQAAEGLNIEKRPSIGAYLRVQASRRAGQQSWRRGRSVSARMSRDQ
jgi:hypothetical protein